jgi:hypothetical protein
VGFDMKFVNPRPMVEIHYFHNFSYTEKNPNQSLRKPCVENPRDEILMESVKAGHFHSDNYHIKSGLPQEKEPLVKNMDSTPENALSCQADARDAYSTMNLMDDDP